MDILILALFCISLFVCVIFDFSIFFALFFGLFVFSFYALKIGRTPAQLIKMIISGVSGVKNILVTFMLIGALTSLWRASGTISVIVNYAAATITGTSYLLMSFLLCSAVSVLTGTSFGTAATMGVICATMGRALGINPILSGGAILSGSFFGDRCSPFSTSALLVAELTKTDIFDNIKKMVKTAAVPFSATCLIYIFIGFLGGSSAVAENPGTVFSQYFNMSLLCLIPAAAILILSLFKVKVRQSMIISIILSAFVCIFVQKASFVQVLRYAVFGFSSENKAVAALLNGGGILSMAKVALMIAISSAYAGIFKETGILHSIKSFLEKISEKTAPFVSVFSAAAISSLVSCNQALAIMLTNQLCDNIENSGSLAIDMENTAVVIPPLVPWSIAGNVPLSTIGAPALSIIGAFFLIFVPIWNLIVSICKRHKEKEQTVTM